MLGPRLEVLRLYRSRIDSREYCRRLVDGTVGFALVSSLLTWFGWCLCWLRVPKWLAWELWMVVPKWAKVVAVSFALYPRDLPLCTPRRDPSGIRDRVYCYLRLPTEGDTLKIRLLVTAAPRTPISPST